MIETYFEHYVLAGGWAMFLLVPASVVTLLTLVRGWLLLGRKRIVGSGEESDRTSEENALGRILLRLEQLRKQDGQVTAADVRAEVSFEMLDLYALFQPLTVVFVLAPLVGLLGSVSSVMSANLDVALGGTAEALAAAAERALVPTLWGLGVAVLAYGSYALLRARLYFCERAMLWPAVRAAIKPAPRPKGERRLGARRLDEKPAEANTEGESERRPEDPLSAA